MAALRNVDASDSKQAEIGNVRPVFRIKEVMKHPEHGPNCRPRNDALFHTTRWSVVLAARGGEGAEKVARSLESLCEQYWPPLYAYIRHRGYREHDAQDLTQAFFAKLLEKDWLDAVDPARGRFRAFLLMALKRFLSKDRDQTNALKRGGGRLTVPLDGEFVSLLADAKAASPDSLFDRQWALTVLQFTMSQLQKEYTDANRSGDFERLKECLTAERGTIDYAALAAQLGVRPVSARSSVHRMRARFREMFREEVAGTVADPADVEDEMRALFAALSGH